MFASDVVYDEVTDNPTSYLKSIGSNGAASDIGQIGASGSVLIQGLSESPYPGKVYGAQTEGQNELWKIDVTTGGREIVGSFGSGGSGIKELAYDPVNDILYGTDFERLYTINQNTGAAAPKAKRFDEDLSDTSIAKVWALAYDTANDKIYGVDESTNNLFWADTSTGAANLMGYVVMPNGIVRYRVTDIAFDRQTGVLYGIEKDKNPNYFFTIDIDDIYTNGGDTLVPTTNIGVLGEPINVLGLAKPIPEPVTFLLLGSGLLSLTWLARKKSDRS